MKSEDPRLIAQGSLAFHWLGWLSPTIERTLNYMLAEAGQPTWPWPLAGDENPSTPVLS